MLRSNKIDDLKEDIDDLIEIAEVLMLHVGHYGSMQHAHPDAHRDAAKAQGIINRIKQEIGSEVQHGQIRHRAINEG